MVFQRSITLLIFSLSILCLDWVNRLYINSERGLSLNPKIAKTRIKYLPACLLEEYTSYFKAFPRLGGVFPRWQKWGLGGATQNIYASLLELYICFYAAISEIFTLTLLELYICFYAAISEIFTLARTQRVRGLTKCPQFKNNKKRSRLLFMAAIWQSDWRQKMILSTEWRAPFLPLSAKPFRAVFMDFTLTPPHGKCCLFQLKVSHGLMNLSLMIHSLCSQTFDWTAKCSDTDRKLPA